MWLFTTGGFFSIVEHKDNPDYLLVRSRVKGDIEKYWPHVEIQRIEEADYLYRAKIHRCAVETAILTIVADIKYPSFKGAIEDKVRYWTWYNPVNSIMQDMQEDMEKPSE